MNSRVLDHNRSDLVKMLVAIVAVLTLASVAYFVLSSDETDATPADGTKYYYNQLTDLEKQIVNEIETTIPDVDIRTNPDTHEDELFVSYSFPIHDSVIGKTPEQAGDLYTAAYRNLSTVFLWERVDEYFYGGTWGYELTYSAPSGTIVDGTVTFRNYGCVSAFGSDWDSFNTTVGNVRSFLPTAAPINTTNTYTTVKSIHDYICNLLDYDELMPSGMGCRNTATAFLSVDHEVVCEGYAKAFKALCDYYHVPCVTVVGTAITSEGPGNHMWNYVQMSDEKWYVVDCTWDDQTSIIYSYFLAGTSAEGSRLGVTVGEDHIPDPTQYHGLSLPTPSTNTYDSSAYEGFDITFVNYDGTLISRTYYEAGATVTVPSDPTRAMDNTYTYTFKCWLDGSTEMISIPPATENKIYTAGYNSTYRDYEIKFFDTNGTTQIGATQIGHYGDATVAPGLPANYLLIEWEDYSATVTGNMNIKAVKTVTNVSGAVTYNTTSTNVVIGGTELTVAKSSTKPLTINLASGTVVFDDTAKQALAADQTLILEEKSFAILRSSVQSALKNAVVYSITFGTNNSVFEAGKATVSLNFTPRAGQDASNIMLYYVDGDKITEVPSSYADNKLTFTTNHFSTYAIQIPQETPDMVKLIQENWILIAILVFAIIGMALSYKFS